jgi:hypothetical protein
MSPDKKDQTGARCGMRTYGRDRNSGIPADRPAARPTNRDLAA